MLLLCISNLLITHDNKKHYRFVGLIERTVTVRLQIFVVEKFRIKFFMLKSLKLVPILWKFKDMSQSSYKHKLYIIFSISSYCMCGHDLAACSEAHYMNLGMSIASLAWPDPIFHTGQGY